MKYKALALLVAVLMISTGLIAVNADKPTEKGNGIDLTGFHYNLNIIGKKSTWSGGGDYNNPDRHTMFVPANTTDFQYEAPDGTMINGSVAISFTQGPEFAVMDGNAFDDGWCHFELAPGTYRVFIVCKAKPGYDSDITGWIYAEDEYGTWYAYEVGDIQVTKSKKWRECTDLFYVSQSEDIFGIISTDTWVFDYLEFLINYDFGDDPDIEDAMYFWDLMNNGNKLIKLRFYPD